MSEREDDLYTAAVHAGEAPREHLGALAVPIYQAAVFTFPDAEQGAAIHEGEQPGFFYGRMGNPTQAALEAALCRLEGGEAALALASGMAAVTTTLLTLLAPGDHLIAPESLYATTNALLDQVLQPFGVAVTYVDATDPANYAAAIRPTTKALYLETPANPTLKLVDIPAVVAIAREHGLTTVLDNTFATPFNQRPLALGVDAVVHSATKYLGGHGDLTAGALVGPAALVHRARWQTTKILGGVIAPQTAWLVLRGIKTLALRMERHNANALAVAEFLAGHPKVQAVHYPGLASHPQHALARRQMRGYGGMVAFDVGGVEEGRRLVNNVELCALAVSLGDVATLIQHSASMTHASVPRERRLAVGITDGLLRLSVGIERAADIIADLDGALRHV
ncbi:MAG TPA: PLP-dependent aspartate aminotransferase family protein [Thermomicrobiales bacterium]|nr:PLP-dependent aspartate aminotransferase family protein [Thermomicrobiales bacterium]